MSLYITECTFIVLERLASYSAEQTETDAMVGDVNVFIDDDGCAELEVMIAGMLGGSIVLHSKDDLMLNMES